MGLPESNFSMMFSDRLVLDDSVLLANTGARNKKNLGIFDRIGHFFSKLTGRSFDCKIGNQEYAMNVAETDRFFKKIGVNLSDSGKQNVSSWFTKLNSDPVNFLRVVSGHGLQAGISSIDDRVKIVAAERIAPELATDKRIMAGRVQQKDDPKAAEMILFLEKNPGAGSIAPPQMKNLPPVQPDPIRLKFQANGAILTKDNIAVMADKTRLTDLQKSLAGNSRADKTWYGVDDASFKAKNDGSTSFQLIITRPYTVAREIGGKAAGAAHVAAKSGGENSGIGTLLVSAGAAAAGAVAGAVVGTVQSMRGEWLTKNAEVTMSPSGAVTLSWKEGPGYDKVEFESHKEFFEHIQANWVSMGDVQTEAARNPAERVFRELEGAMYETSKDLSYRRDHLTELRTELQKNGSPQDKLNADKPWYGVAVEPHDANEKNWTSITVSLDTPPGTLIFWWSKEQITITPENVNSEKVQAFLARIADKQNPAVAMVQLESEPVAIQELGGAASAVPDVERRLSFTPVTKPSPSAAASAGQPVRTDAEKEASAKPALQQALRDAAAAGFPGFSQPVASPAASNPAPESDISLRARAEAQAIMDKAMKAAKSKVAGGRAEFQRTSAALQSEIAANAPLVEEGSLADYQRQAAEALREQSQPAAIAAPEYPRWLMAGSEGRKAGLKMFRAIAQKIANGSVLDTSKGDDVFYFALAQEQGQLQRPFTLSKKADIAIAQAELAAARKGLIRLPIMQHYYVVDAMHQPGFFAIDPKIQKDSMNDFNRRLAGMSAAEKSELQAFIQQNSAKRPDFYNQIKI